MLVRAHPGAHWFVLIRCLFLFSVSTLSTFSVEPREAYQLGFIKSKISAGVKALALKICCKIYRLLAKISIKQSVILVVIFGKGIFAESKNRITLTELILLMRRTALRFVLRERDSRNFFRLLRLRLDLCGFDRINASHKRT